MEFISGSPPTLEASVRTIITTQIERLSRGSTDLPGIDGFAYAYDLVREALTPFHLDRKPTKLPVATVQPYFKDLYRHRLIGSMLDWFLQEVRSHQYMITDEINTFMNDYQETGDVDVIQRMLTRVVDWWEAWGLYVPLFNPYLEGTLAYRRVCSVHLNASLPPAFRPAFRALILSTLPPDETNPTSDAARTVTIFDTFAQLGLLADHEHHVGSIVKEFTTGHLKTVCAGEWDRPLWAEMKTWFDKVVKRWITLAYVRKWMKPEDGDAIVEPVAAKHLWHMYEALAELRTSEIFDIIVDYPDSAPALADLKECLFQTGSRMELVRTLRASTKKRLLHPGADTKDIITQYISTIRCLRVLDPMGSLLFSVADPIRQYLRERPDTIRTIVQNLIEPKGEFATGDDDDGEIKPLQDTQHLADDYGDFGWMPEPFDADPAFRTTKATDIVSTLVSIYDSKDIFVKELQVLLGKRLLEVKDRDYDAEIRNLEILKLRFGDTPLQVCDVMMKDITDSRRADQHIHNARKAKDGEEESVLPMHATIISRLFWPPIASNQLVMPGQFRDFQEGYAKYFSTFKPDRKIRFLSNLGSVTLDLEFSDRKVTLEDVTPLQAAIVELFSSQEVWSADDIAEKLGGVDVPSVDKALEFWMDHGVVKSLGNKQYQVLEVAEEGHAAPRPARRAAVAEEDHGAMMEVEQRQAEQMRVYWQFIQGMLTNFQSLPTDRIHTMLNFAPNYDRTREQLASFMEALKRENLVDFRDGSWRLVK